MRQLIFLLLVFSCSGEFKQPDANLMAEYYADSDGDFIIDGLDPSVGEVNFPYPTISNTDLSIFDLDGKLTKKWAQDKKASHFFQEQMALDILLNKSEIYFNEALSFHPIINFDESIKNELIFSCKEKIEHLQIHANMVWHKENYFQDLTQIDFELSTLNPANVNQVIGNYSLDSFQDELKIDFKDITCERVKEIFSYPMLLKLNNMTMKTAQRADIALSELNLDKETVRFSTVEAEEFKVKYFRILGTLENVQKDEQNYLDLLEVERNQDFNIRKEVVAENLILIWKSNKAQLPHRYDSIKSLEKNQLNLTSWQPRNKIEIFDNESLRFRIILSDVMKTKLVPYPHNAHFRSQCDHCRGANFQGCVYNRMSPNGLEELDMKELKGSPFRVTVKYAQKQNDTDAFEEILPRFQIIGKKLIADFVLNKQREISFADVELKLVWNVKWGQLTSVFHSWGSCGTNGFNGDLGSHAANIEWHADLELLQF